MIAADKSAARWLVVTIVGILLVVALWIVGLVWVLSNDDNSPSEFELRCQAVGGYVIDINGGKGSDVRCLVEYPLENQ